MTCESELGRRNRDEGSGHGSGERPEGHSPLVQRGVSVPSDEAELTHGVALVGELLGGGVDLGAGEVVDLQALDLSLIHI